MIDYDPHDWRSHLFDIQGSMLREIAGRVTSCVVWSVVVVVVVMFVLPWLAINSTVHGLVGVALGLLLVFRTNSSYERFWEGRKLWGGIVNESRNLARSASVFLKDDPELFESTVRWTIAWAYASMNSLRGQADLGPIASELPAGEVAEVLAAGHVPLAVSRRITATLAEAKNRDLISDYVLMNLDQNVQLLIDYLGACERIHKTPLPFAYVVHLRRALILYCFSLPLALVSTYGWWTILGTAIVAYVFFGIEEIGVEIEDPFGNDTNDLPLDRICGTIERDLRGVLATPTSPAPSDQAA